MPKSNTLRARVRGKLKLVTPPSTSESQTPTPLRQVSKPSKRLRDDELKDRHMEELAEKGQLIAYMSSGMSAQEALAKVSMSSKRSVSWAQKLFRAYKKDGSQALIDR